MKKTRMARLIIAIALLGSVGVLNAADSLPPLQGGKVPRNVKDLWANYDSTKEPLEVKVVREWKDDVSTYRYLTYTIGTFKGKKATMAAFYAFPTKHKGKLPALIQMHGGGQRAAIHSVKYGADNGYATLSINWGGRKMEKARSGDPSTDWGAVDATQTGHNSHYGSLMPDKLTIDTVESPRNNNWFLIIIAAKRGITFLQKQREVDPDRIGAFGHSMGGKLTVMLTGADKRIKAAAPSCGGSGSAPDHIRNRKNAGVRRRHSELYHKTIDDALYIKEIAVPMLYVGPHNDFNGILDNMYANWRGMKSKTVNYTITPHMNHRAISEHLFAGMLFFEDHLKGVFDFPETPAISASLKTKDSIPAVVLKPYQVKNVAKVVIYYSVDPHILTRFWRTAAAVRKGDAWQAKCPVYSTDQPLYIMANVYYTLTHPVVGYHWMRKAPKTFGISSEMIGYSPEQLKEAKVKAAPDRSRIIEKDFDDYQDWYRLNWDNPHWWSAYTRKIKDPAFAAPDGAKLTLDVKAAQDAVLFFEVQDNSWGAFPGQNSGQYYARVDIKGSDKWQSVGVTVADFKLFGKRTKHPLKSWRHVTELGIRGRVKVVRDGKQIELPAPPIRWSAPRAFRNLRWEDGTYRQTVKNPDGKKTMSAAERKKQFQKGIDDSIELEKRHEAEK
ncbi:MAG: acetylxylan esterase [Phycisphaerae bacterium]|nr:acetylxylan esterase [Phycisphaerae bacterium]